MADATCCANPVSLVRSSAFISAGMPSPRRTAMKAMTRSSSMRLNPAPRRGRGDAFDVEDHMSRHLLPRGLLPSSRWLQPHLPATLAGAGELSTVFNWPDFNATDGPLQVGSMP